MNKKKSPNLLQLAEAKRQASSSIMEEVAVGMEEASRAELYGGDVRGMMDLMKGVVEEVKVQSRNITKPEAKNLVKNVTKVGSWLDIIIYKNTFRYKICK